MVDPNEPEIARLREEGLPAKAIARRLGLRPADVQRVVVALARRTADTIGESPGRFLAAWVNAGWSAGLGVAESRVAWRGMDVRPGDRAATASTPAGFALVVVARAARHGDVAVAGYLLDLWCLGVRDAFGPRVVQPEELEGLVKEAFRPIGAAGPISLDLAQALVQGSAAWAHTLGFEPAPPFTKAAALLGTDPPPDGVTFGRDGVPVLRPAARDDVEKITALLRARVGEDGFRVEKS